MNLTTDPQTATRVRQGVTLAGGLAGAVIAFAVAAWDFHASHTPTHRRASPAAAEHAPSALDSRPGKGAKIPFDDAIKIARDSLEALQDVADYKAVFTKAELIDGRLLEQTMDLKFRSKPFSVYLGHRTRRGTGREVLYVAGANDNKLLVHEAGLKSIMGTLSLGINSARVMETNRHPITDIGLARLAESAIATWNIDRRQADPAQVDVELIHDVPVGAAQCALVQVTHHVQDPRIGYRLGRVYFDQATGFPIQAELYGWPARPDEESPLLEKYLYTEIETNVGLSSRDFDPRNPQYQFDVDRE